MVLSLLILLKPSTRSTILCYFPVLPTLDLILLLVSVSVAILEIDDDFSDEAVVSSGVPQGSVLGPLLFSLFVNSLPTHLEGVPTVMFADNTTLHVIGHFTNDISAKLSRVLASAHKWLLESGL